MTLLHNFTAYNHKQVSRCRSDSQWSMPRGGTTSPLAGGGARLLAFPEVTREHLRSQTGGHCAAEAFELRPGEGAGVAEASHGAEAVCLQLAVPFALGHVDRAVLSAEGYFESVARVCEGSPVEDLLRALDKIERWALQISARQLGAALAHVYPSSPPAAHDSLPTGTPSAGSRGRAALRAAVQHVCPIMVRLIETALASGALPRSARLECVCDTITAVGAVDDRVGGGALVEEVMVPAGLPAALVRLLAWHLTAAGDAAPADAEPAGDEPEGANGAGGRDLCSRVAASLWAICCPMASTEDGEVGAGRDGGGGMRRAAIRDVVAAGIADAASTAIRQGASCGDSLRSRAAIVCPSARRCRVRER